MKNYKSNLRKGRVQKLDLFQLYTHFEILQSMLLLWFWLYSLESSTQKLVALVVPIYVRSCHEVCQILKHIF